MTDQTRRRAEAVLGGLDEIIGAADAFYCDLHQHPELSLSEERTAGKVADWLRESGLEVATGVGGHGVVGMLRNGNGPTVMIRGDMDALPILEQTGVPYASTVTAKRPDGSVVPVMHACGHDVHTTSLVTTARLLAQRRDMWKGTLMAVAQPAEEIFQGAAPMLRDGLFTRFAKPDVALGQHTWPLPVGTIAHRPGTMMSAAATLDVIIYGKGGHGSQPDLSIDPVVIASSIVTRLQTVISREVKPGEPAVLTVGKFHAGTQANVIPDRAILGVNIRSQKDDMQRRLVDAIGRIVKAECEAGRCPREPDITMANSAPCTVNDPAAVVRVRSAHAAWFGEANIMDMECLMGTEDFSLYGAPGCNFYGGEAVPIAYWFVGVIDERAWSGAPGATVMEKLRSVPGVHSPQYLPQRPAALRAGIEAMTVAALAWLG